MELPVYVWIFCVSCVKVLPAKLFWIVLSRKLLFFGMVYLKAENGILIVVNLSGVYKFVSVCHYIILCKMTMACHFKILLLPQPATFIINEVLWGWYIEHFTCNIPVILFTLYSCFRVVRIISAVFWIVIFVCFYIFNQKTF